MAEQIRDGAGGRNLARVDKNFRLHTKTVTTTETLDANHVGEAYNINTGLVSLTNAVDTPLIYVKNNEDKHLIIEAIAIGMFASTGGSSTADVYATFIRNPTTGTMIENTPTTVPINSNRNYGSSQALDVDAYVGATGETMTNGEDHILVRLSTNQRAFVTINEVLPKGTTFGVKIKPPTSNTAMSCYVAVICHLEQGI